MSAPAELTPELIAARIERLPISAWHTRVRLILGTATFFDAFDLVAIAFVIPTLIGLWHLRPGDIGLLISSGFAGQFFGAAIFGGLAERYGRVRVLNWTIVMLAVFGIACGCAWDYRSLLIFRFIQGLALGGENPVAATYINEIAKAGKRGGFVLFYQFVYPVGFIAASVSSIWIVPHIGWQWVFIIGAFPGFLVIPLRRIVPESPRWLASKGRLVEADAIVSRIERLVTADGAITLPPLSAHLMPESQERSDWRGLFRGLYLKRTLTVWGIWIAASSVGYSLLTWLPTIFRTVYKLSIRDALLFSSVGTLAHLVACIVAVLIIDGKGRRPVLALAFLFSALPLFALGFIGTSASAVTVMILAGIGGTFNAIPQLVVWVYTPEIYPTRMRSIGTGIASCAGRLATTITPVLVGFILQTSGITGVFLLFAILATLGALAVQLFAVEPKGRLLEEISP